MSDSSYASAVKLTLSPTVTSADEGDITILSITINSLTLTEAVSVIPSAVALTIPSPADVAVKFPLDLISPISSSVDQVNFTFLIILSDSSYASAVKLTLSPTVTTADEGDITILSKEISSLA